jgi:hypothetical protein
VPPVAVTRVISASAARSSGTKFSIRAEQVTIDRAVLERDRVRRAAMEGYAAAELLFGLVQILGRWLDAHDEGRRTTLENRRAERARAAADIEPALTRRDVEPGEERRSDASAPDADVLLVTISTLPHASHAPFRQVERSDPSAATSTRHVDHSLECVRYCWLARGRVNLQPARTQVS